MKNLFQTIRNIFKIEDLRIRILNTLGFLLIYRLGSFIVLPGVDPVKLQQFTEGATTGILGMINMFAGGAFSRASIFALGIMPYISASIVIQLLSVAVPYFQKLQREGESGRQKINQITRVLTIIITAVQAVGYIINLRAQTEGAIIAITNPGVMSYTLFLITNVIILTSGTMFVMWLGEKITDRGIGNGISIIIMIGIIASLPTALLGEFEERLGRAGGGLVVFLVEILALLAVILVTVLLVQGVRRVPVQYVKRSAGGKQYGGVRQYIPLKVNASGVMPIIFAQALMFIPSTVATFFPDSEAWRGIGQAFTDFTTVWYNIAFAILIILFTYFYTAVTINSQQISDDLKRNGGFVPGVKPGKATADFLDTIISRITLPGSIFLAIIAILPALAVQLGVNTLFAQFFGGTSLLIIVGVVLDTLQQIESHLLMRHYDGILSSGKLKGRSSLGGVA